jgi:general secretion pathway protein F
VTTFSYEAARADGALVRGLVDAASGPEAAAALSGRGLFPVAVEPAHPPDGWLHALRRPSTRALATVFQSLAALVEAGVPLQKALQASARVASGLLRDALGRVEARVREGSSLAQALAEERGLCSPVTLGLLRAGERGVGLGAGLAQASAELEARAELEGRLRAALAYPGLLAAVGSVSVAFIVLFVVPRFATLLGDLGQAIPPATRLLVAGSDALRRYGLYAIPGLLVALIAGASLLARHRRAAHEWLLALPLIGPLRHAFATARAARTVGALLGTGTPALAALETARGAAGDEAVAARLAQARDRVAEGAALSTALGETRALSETAVQLATIGEGSGRLPQLLLKAAELEARNAERRLKTLVTVLEPALIIVFAGLVAFVAAALLQAVYALRPGGS